MLVKLNDKFIWSKVLTMKSPSSLALLILLISCAQALFASQGKSDGAIRTDMNSCEAGSLSLHNQAVTGCHTNHGGAIQYADDRIPPYTAGNPYDVPLTATEVQARTARANAVLERWKAAARNGGQNAGAAAAAPTPSAPTNSTGSGAGATTYIDDAMRADLKEVLAPNGTQVYPRGVLSGVPGDSEQSAIIYKAEGIGNYFFYRNGKVLPGPQGGIQWSTDKDMQDFAKARRWYQLKLNREPNPAFDANVIGQIKRCDFNLSNGSGSARSEIAEEKSRERVAAQERQKKLATRKKVGDCVVIPGGTGFLGLASTVGTVTAVSGDTITWVAHLHRNGYWYQGIGVKVWNPPEDFDRGGSAQYNQVGLCDQH